jgi:hypothetical protein
MSEGNREFSEQVKAISKNKELHLEPELLTAEERESNLACANCDRPIIEDDVVCRFCGAPIQQRKIQRVKEFIARKKQLNIFDVLAAIIIFVIWFTASGWIVSTYSLSWGLGLALAILWLFFIFIEEAILN